MPIVDVLAVDAVDAFRDDGDSLDDCGVSPTSEIHEDQASDSNQHIATPEALARRMALTDFCFAFAASWSCVNI